jgi:hypothetical protein
MPRESPVTNSNKCYLTNETLKSIPVSRGYSMQRFLLTDLSLAPYHTATMHGRANHSEKLEQKVNAIDDILKNK